MSFSSEVKEELAKRISPARHCQIAELAAIMHFSGQYGRSAGGDFMIGFQTENEAVVRKGFTLLKKTYNIDTDVKISEEQMRSVIDKIGDLSEPVSPLLIKNSCCQRAFLRGAFLCIGSMSDPQKSYHLEFVCTDEDKARQLQSVIQGFDIEIAKLHQRLGTTIIYVTHDQTEAMTLGTRIVVMKDGVIQQVDTPQNLYEKPQNLFVAGFMGSPQMNFLDAVVEVKGETAYLNVAGISIPLPPAKSKKVIDGGYNGKTVTFGIRPEDVYDSQMMVEAKSDSVFESTIRVYELLGAEVFLYFDLGDFPMTARVDPRTTARPGDKVKFAIDVEKIHVFDKETEQIITN